MNEAYEVNDFIYQLLDFLKSLDLPIPVKVGLLDTEDTVALAPMEGGSVLNEFYNGFKEKRIPYQIGIKTLNDQQLALDIMGVIVDKLENVSGILSQNGSYKFINIQVLNEPFFRGQDAKGFFFYRLEIEADLIILKLNNK